MSLVRRLVSLGNQLTSVRPQLFCAKGQLMSLMAKPIRLGLQLTPLFVQLAAVSAQQTSVCAKQMSIHVRLMDVGVQLMSLSAKLMRQKRDSSSMSCVPKGLERSDSRSERQVYHPSRRRWARTDIRRDESGTPVTRPSIYPVPFAKLWSRRATGVSVWPVRRAAPRRSPPCH